MYLSFNNNGKRNSKTNIDLLMNNFIKYISKSNLSLLFLLFRIIVNSTSTRHVKHSFPSFSILLWKQFTITLKYYKEWYLTFSLWKFNNIYKYKAVLKMLVLCCFQGILWKFHKKIKVTMYICFWIYRLEYSDAHFFK